MFLRSAMFPTAGAAKATKSLVHAYSQSSWAAAAISAQVPPCISALSGAMTAGTLKTLLSISGVGVRLFHLTFRTNDATARTIRVKITVDGTVICDATSASISTSGNGGLWAGFRSTSTPNAPITITSNSVLLIEYASSVTETDKITAEYFYNTES